MCKNTNCQFFLQKSFPPPPPQNWHNSVHYQKFTLCALITYEFSLTTVVVGHVIEKVLESHHHKKKIKNTDLAFVSQSNSHASCFLLIYDQA